MPQRQVQSYPIKFSTCPVQPWAVSCMDKNCANNTWINIKRNSKNKHTSRVPNAQLLLKHVDTCNFKQVSQIPHCSNFRFPRRDSWYSRSASCCNACFLLYSNAITLQSHAQRKKDMNTRNSLSMKPGKPCFLTSCSLEISHDILIGKYPSSLAIFRKIFPISMPVHGNYRNKGSRRLWKSRAVHRCSFSLSTTIHSQITQMTDHTKQQNILDQTKATPHQNP